LAVSLALWQTNMPRSAPDGRCAPGDTPAPDIIPAEKAQGLAIFP
jgi:hypothetical protein